jgi:predicted ribosome quality control (RQC) complex YloA/Tae2 family protein
VLIRSSMPIPFERLVRLDFGSHPDTKPELSLICEIQGQYSNVIMVDADENVVLAARQVGRAMLCPNIVGHVALSFRVRRVGSVRLEDARLSVSTD